MTLASGGSPIFPLVVHLASSAVTPAGSVPKYRGDKVCGCSRRDYVCCVCECYRRGILVMDVIWR